MSSSPGTTNVLILAETVCFGSTFCRQSHLREKTGPEQIAMKLATVCSLATVENGTVMNQWKEINHNTGKIMSGVSNNLVEYQLPAKLFAGTRRRISVTLQQEGTSTTEEQSRRLRTG